MARLILLLIRLSVAVRPARACCLSRWLTILAAAGALVFAASASIQAAPPVIPESVKNNARLRVEYGHATGVMIGIVSPTGRAYFGAGRLHADRPEELTAKTLFEIGSITKAFTGTLLAAMAVRGEVSYGQTVQSLLPAAVAVPRGNTEITLLQLATHRSGLPDNPDNLCSASLHDLFNCYSTARLYEFLGAHVLAREPGSEWVYSNLGLGLLGHALSRAGGAEYEALLRERLLDPLGLQDTRIELSAEQRARRATSHWGAVPWPDFAIPGLEGAGALHSTAEDLLTFLEHISGLRTNVLAGVAAEAIRRRAGTQSSTVAMALGWLLLALPSGEIVQHDGATYGQNAFIGFHRASRRGVVVLINNRLSTYGGAAELGLHLLDATLPLAAPRRPAVVAAETLDGYAGRYQSAAGLAFDVHHRFGALVMNFSGDGSPGFSVHAESATTFGAYEYGIDGKARFTVNGDSARLAWTQHGATLQLERVAVPGALAAERDPQTLLLELRGTPNFAYEIETSTDLRAWTLHAKRRPEDGAFAPAVAAPQSQAFFRARFPAFE